MERNLKIIKFDKKVGEKKIDEIINVFYIHYKNDPSRKNIYQFDFYEVEWIDNQGILVITALLKYLAELRINFKFHFLKGGSGEFTDARIAKQFVEIWEVWKIYQIAPNREYNKYFDIDGNYIENLKKRFSLNISVNEIYDRYGITPFLVLNKIDKYDDREIANMLSKIYNLNDVTNEILKENNCFLPFENETISSIITKELYENFLDHFKKSLFINENDYAFMSISLKKKLKPNISDDKIEFILSKNFKEEKLSELANFFYDKKNQKYKNESLLEISFLDFGEGIPKSLSKSYLSSDKKGFSEKTQFKNLDSKVLEYAFMPASSQHELQDRYSNIFMVPRGLFDVLSIVKRFEGLLIARSNYGKVAFDFSDNKDFSDAVQGFGEAENFFFGTLISIYIPERNLHKEFDYSSIKLLDEPKFNFNNPRINYLSIFSIQNELKKSYINKDDIYNLLFEKLVVEFNKLDENLIYIDFKGYEIDERITKKIIYFLCSDYNVNSSKNIIVINPPPQNFLEVIREEISNFNAVDKKFTFHPTPFVYVNLAKNYIELFWLGVYSDNDVKKLNDLLYESHNLTYYDFENPDDIIGHINSYDEYKNLVSIIDSANIIDFYKKIVLESRKKELDNIIIPNVIKEEGSIFLCNGNYYQYEYLQLFDVLNNHNTLEYLANELFIELTTVVKDLENYLFVGITSSSKKIIQFFIDKKFIPEEKCILLNNYFSFQKEENFMNSFHLNDQIILICDVISTGYMVQKLEKHLNKYNSSLKYVGVLIDAIDVKFKETDYSKIKEKLVSVYPFEMKKYLRTDISNLLQNRQLKVNRINPFTNTPIKQSVDNTNYNNSVLLTNEEFLKLVDSKNINVGYFNFNNLIHPYFFNMDKILSDPEKSHHLLISLFHKLGEQVSLADLELIFYPKDSAIKSLDFTYLRDNILKNQIIGIYELERFPTNEGWRFSHPPQFLINNSKNKNVLILDDGSCSGESILQMIDEVAFLQVRKITVLSIIGRVNEHKREFFSRIKSINNNVDNVEINIFFGCHWHIPTYYLSKSPVVAERYWLKKLIEFPNTPYSVKKIAKGVSLELKAKNVYEGNNNHLLKSKDDEDVFDDMILVRDHFGKITDFRFYKEYFEHFDSFISLYESKSKVIRGEYPYKLIEIYGGILIHEPYLFDKIKMIVPDIVEKIQDFVIKLFWAPVNIRKEDLYYKWDNKNLFHLIFIVFKEEELFEVLTPVNLSTLITEYAETQSDLDYLLFKLSYYLDINTERRIKDTSMNQSAIKSLINALIENENIKDWRLSKLRTYRSFVSTLIDTNEDFKSKITIVKHNYDKITDDKYHSESISTQFSILIIQLESLRVDFEFSTEKIVRETWEKVDRFLTELLTFSISYPSFLSAFGSQVFELVEGKGDSLRINHGRISDKINRLDLSTNFEELQVELKSIQTKFIKSESEYYGIFHNIATYKILEEYNSFKEKLKHDYINIKLKEEINCKPEIILDVPLNLIRNVVFEQILNNLRHADFNFPVEIEITDDKGFFYFTIKNISLSNSSKEIGGGFGINFLNNLNLYPDDLIKYTNKAEENIFIQKLTIKTI